MSFAVVHFLEEDQFSEVPSNWLLEGHEKCYWPPKNVKNFSSLIKNRVQPTSDWDIFDIRLENFCDNLDKARNKAANRDYTSSEEVNRGRGKRTILYANQSSSSEEEDDPAPPLPQLKVSQLQNINFNEGTMTNSKGHLKDTTSSLPSWKNTNFLENIEEVPDTDNGKDTEELLTERVPSGQMDVERNLRVIFASDESPEVSEYTTATIIANGDQPSSASDVVSQVMPSNKMSEMENLLRMTSRILKYVKDIDRRLESLEQQKDNSKWDIFKETLPCQNMQRVEVLHNLLAEDEHRRAYKNFILNLGGVNSKNRVNRLMSVLFTNEFAIGCSWLGQRNNIRVSAFDCIQIAKDCFTQHMQAIEFETFGSEWFRLAKLRFQREKK